MYELAIYVVELSVLDTVYLHIFFLCLGFVFWDTICKCFDYARANRQSLYMYTTGEHSCIIYHGRSLG